MCFVSKPSRITLVVLSMINTSYQKLPFGSGDKTPVAHHIYTSIWYSLYGACISLGQSLCMLFADCSAALRRRGQATEGRGTWPFITFTTPWLTTRLSWPEPLTFNEGHARWLVDCHNPRLLPSVVLRFIWTSPDIKYNWILISVALAARVALTYSRRASRRYWQSIGLYT